MWAKNLNDCKDPSDYGYCTCAVYSCGYSQPHRNWLTFKRLIEGTAETDCSYGVGWWLWKGGYLDENPAFSTADERQYLIEHGFTAINANAGFVKLQRNDVLLRDRNDARGVLGHTALYIGDGMQAEALRDENHQAGYEGTTPGDNDGGETVVRALTYDWDWVIRKNDQPKVPIDSVGDCMTFLFTCDGKYSGDVWFYDGGTVNKVYTEEQQETLKYCHLQATGKELPFFHVPNGDVLIDMFPLE